MKTNRVEKNLTLQRQITLFCIELFIMMNSSTLIESNLNSLWSCPDRSTAFFNSTRLDSTRLGSARFNTTRLYSFPFGWSRFESARIGSDRLGSAARDSIGLDSTRLDSLHTIWPRYGGRLCKIKVSTFAFHFLFRVQTLLQFFATLWTNDDVDGKANVLTLYIFS